MAGPYQFTTGETILPDIGELSYYGVTFAPLYNTEMSGPATPDEARRTTKYVEYTLLVDGLVTLLPGQATTDASWETLRRRLSTHGATLVYRGKGFGNLTVNQPGGSVWDVAYGPVPKILTFQPLGASRSAKIKWQVTFRIAELPVHLLGGSTPGVTSKLSTFTPEGARLVNNQSPTPLPGSVLQFNYSARVGYDDDGYSSISIKGTLEVPATRSNVNDRAITNMVDGYRQAWLDIQVDLTKFKVTRRSFDYSRDKRICEWEFACEELAPMGLPQYATNASGTMSVRPVRKETQFSFLYSPLWYVSLRATYTIRKDYPRRAAWWAFTALMWCRMWSCVNGQFPDLTTPRNAPQQKNAVADVLFQGGVVLAGGLPGLAWEAGYSATKLLLQFQKKKAQQPKPRQAQCVLTDFGFDEGLYRESKTITFNAAWFLPTTIQSLLAASGVWAQPAGTGGNVWAQSVQDVSGWKSWLANRMDPAADVIVDLGGGAPPLSPPFGG